MAYPCIQNTMAACFELAGVFSYRSAAKHVQNRDHVTITHEPDNAHDSHALAVKHAGYRVGYIRRVDQERIRPWLQASSEFIVCDCSYDYIKIEATGPSNSTA